MGQQSIGENIVGIRKKKHPLGMGAFKRGLTISPFQIPLLVYLAIQGILICINADKVAELLGDIPTWSVLNLGALLFIGGVLATFSRFNDNERLETFGLLLTLLGLVVGVGIAIVTRRYGDIIGEVAIGLGCWLRARVLLKAQQAEKLAIKLSNNESNHERETP